MQQSSSMAPQLGQDSNSSADELVLPSSKLPAAEVLYCEHNEAEQLQGWPLLHRVIFRILRAGAAVLDTDSKAGVAEAGSSSSMDQQAPQHRPAGTAEAGSSSSSSIAEADMQQYFDAFEKCLVDEDVNIKGLGGFTPLHVACLGHLTAQQRK